MSVLTFLAGRLKATIRSFNMPIKAKSAFGIVTLSRTSFCLGLGGSERPDSGAAVLAAFGDLACLAGFGAFEGLGGFAAGQARSGCPAPSTWP